MSSVLWKASVSSACQEDPVAPLITVSIFKLKKLHLYLGGYRIYRSLLFFL